MELKTEKITFDGVDIDLKYIGIHYKLPNIWNLINYDYFKIKVEDYNKVPIKYCEVGVFYGINFALVEKTYANHPDSELVAIDPWKKYDEYDEYIDSDMEEIYKIAKFNMDLNITNMNKVKIIRDFSHKAINHLEDDYFDIIYIDGNHESFAVLEDLILYFRKLKKFGIMIVDDVHDNKVYKGVMSFLECYGSKILVAIIENYQLYLRKM